MAFKDTDKTVFIGRRDDGSVYAVWNNRQQKDADHYNMEEVLHDHPDVVAFHAAMDDKVKAKGPSLADVIAVLTTEQKQQLKDAKKS